MMHSNLLKEVERVENRLAENTRKLAKADLQPGKERGLNREREKLKKYKACLLNEWRHLNA